MEFMKRKIEEVWGIEGRGIEEVGGIQEMVFAVSRGNKRWGRRGVMIGRTRRNGRSVSKGRKRK